MFRNRRMKKSLFSINSAQAGAGIGRKRVNEPLHTEASAVDTQKPEVFREDEVSREPTASSFGVTRTIPLVTDPKPEVKGSGKKYLPGDKLKMKLIRKMMKAKEEQKGKGAGMSKHNIIAHELFPKLVKMLNPKAKIPKKGLDGLAQLIKKNPKKTVSIISNVFEKMGHTPNPQGRKMIKTAVDSISNFQEQSGKGISKKNKKWLSDFGRGFKQGFSAVFKPGIKALAVIDPMLAPVASITNELL